MPASESNIHLNQGEVWLGGTPPAAGSDPTSPTAGTPSVFNSMTTGFAAPTSGGRYVGFTNGPATLTYRPTFYMVETEQAFAEVVTHPTAEEASLGFTMLENDYRNLAAAMVLATTRTISTTQYGMYVGSLATVTTQLVAMCSRKRSGTGYFMATLYKAYSNDGAALNFERRAETRNAVTMRCQADLTRPIGDQLYQLVEHTANPA